MANYLGKRIEICIYDCVDPCIAELVFIVKGLDDKQIRRWAKTKVREWAKKHHWDPAYLKWDVLGLD